MSKRLIMAMLGLCLASAVATTAEARLDHGPVPSYYDQPDPTVYRAKSDRTEKRKSGSVERHTRPAKRYARDASSKRRTQARKSAGRHPALQARAVTAGHGGGGGPSRACLKSEARALLSRIEGQFGPVHVISTCRPGAVVAGTGRPSKHRYGLAIDFNAGGRKGAIVQWLIANHHSGGTMTYRGMNHIHVDIGPRFVSLGSGGRRSSS